MRKPGGDRPEPPPQQGLVDPDEGPVLDGPEQDLNLNLNVNFLSISLVILK